MVLAVKAHTTPIANVVPKARRGIIGENAFDRKAATVVITESESASLSRSKDSTQALAGFIPLETLSS